MPRRALFRRLMLCSLALLVVVGAGVAARAGEDRPAWDQDEALRRVHAMLDLEKKGTPWNDVAWHTDPAKAIAAAQKQDKPLFVYWYVDKGGPKSAPC